MDLVLASTIVITTFAILGGVGWIANLIFHNKKNIPKA